MISIEDLKELMNRQPFEPFTIVITSGETVDITNPDNLAVGESRLSYFVPKSDRWIMVRLNQIASIRSMNTAA